jgi:AcrR family transcriptional regulator
VPLSTIEESDVRKRILDVATALFADKGYGSTSVREVVEAAGVTKPTLYYYFANKEALFIELINMHMDGLDDIIRASLTGVGSIRERLRNFIRAYADGALQNKDVVRLMWTCQAPTDHEQPQIDLMSMHMRKIAHMGVLFTEGITSGEFRADLDVDYAVRGFIGMVDLHTMAMVHGLPADDDYAVRILDLFYRGVSG